DGKVVLEPRLGTRIEGSVRLPAGTDAKSVGGTVALEVTRRTGGSNEGEQRAAHELAKGLDFEVDALPPAKDPELTYSLSYDGAACLGNSKKLAPEAGKTLAVELELRRGIVLSGVVRDERGAPLDGVEVSAGVRSFSLSGSSSSWRSATTRGESDGSFH